MIRSRSGNRNGVRQRSTLIGLATSTRNTVSATPETAIAGNAAGCTSRPIVREHRDLA